MKSIISKKEDGNIIIYIALYFMLTICLLVLLRSYRVHMMYNTKIDIEDSLAVSVLSSVLIDDKLAEDSLYDLVATGMSEEDARLNATLYIEPNSAYSNMQDYLKLNLGLTDGWKYVDNPLVEEVILEKFIVYNVTTVIDNGVIRKDIDVYEYANDTLVSHTYYENGVAEQSVVSPNGTVITKTSCYARVGFTLEGIFGAEYYKYRDKLVGASLSKVE